MEIEIDPLSTDLRTYTEPKEVEPNEFCFEIKCEGVVEENSDYTINIKPEVPNTHKEKNGLVTQEFATQDAKEVVDSIDGEVEEDKPLAKLKIKKNKVNKEDKKEKLRIPRKKRNYNKKVNEDFQEEEDPNGVPYYACSVCNVKYTTIHGLYNHVLGHKNRLTSWGLRVKNQEIKKKRRKEEKRLKKALKIEQKGIKTEPGLEIPTSLSQFVENVTENSLQNGDNGTLSNKLQDSTDQTNVPDNNVDDNKSVLGQPPGNAISGVEANKPAKDDAKKLKQNTKGSQYTGTDEKEREAFNLEKIFKCGHCNKQFHLGYYLKLHVRSHTGEKPYSCEECGISFITASKLGRHKKRTHLSVRFVCRICRRPYTRLEFLTRHFNRHHAADKIEGEPYDYNAILPYLKELEEELEKKKEQEEAIKKEGENLLDLFPPLDGEFPKTESELKPKPEELWTFNEDHVKQELEVKEEIKVEAPEELSDAPDYPEGADDDFADEPAAFKDEDDDEDYFPADTWLPPPSPAPAHAPADVQAVDQAKAKRKRTRNQGDKGENPLHCKLCDKTLSTQYYLKIHMRTHTGDKPYKCYLCTKGFITSSKRNRHVMTHDNWEEECKSKLNKEEKGEIKEESGEEVGNVLSKLAKQGRRARSKVKRAIQKGATDKRNRKKKPFACVHCCSRFSSSAALQLHVHSHETGEKPAAAHADLREGGFQCRYCLATFDDMEQGREHESTHGGPKPYLCTVCGRTYQKKETMVYHRRHHDCPNKYQCDVCPKTFNLLCKLQRHLHSHRPDKYVVRYECPVCAHIFNTKWHIEMHLTTHEKEGVIVPENRGQIIAMVMQNARKIPLDTEKPSTSLKTLAPTDERSRICNICGEIFNHFYYLEQHLKTHGSTFSAAGHEDLDERKYICKVCNKGFKLSYYLKLHSYTHTKDRPFICQQCGKGFITRGKLKRHAETHAGLKKYQCHICCKFFTRPSYLRIHVRTIHGNQDYNFKPDLDYNDIMGVSGGGGMSVLSQGSV